ncbi:MAG TPA: hypothetical protein VGN63_16885 [Flavisolibacter sp.]|jgi:hypothetical protein|nr:hypothetical protein [Flavisolibacter sp.]
MSTKYLIHVTPLSEREATITHEKNNSSRKQRFYEYRNTPEDLPIVRIPIGVPVYRVANYRTSLYQMRWIKEKETRTDFFALGEENESVQRIQHAFLWELAQGEKESIASIIGILKSEGQRVPLLITSNGVVVNGNRRLAAMRELLETHPHFSHVDCMVLPAEATEDDLKEIEVRLQMTPETRMPYDWIDECIAIKDLRQREKSFETIANWMRLDPAKVKNKLLVLNEIDLYLRDWKGEEGNYGHLDEAEEIVTQITKRIKAKDGIQQEIARRIGWILLDQRGSDGRVYELRDVTGNLAQEVVSKIHEVYPTEIANTATVETSPSEALELEFDEFDRNNSDQALVSFLDTSRNNPQLQQDIVNICKVVVETKKVQQNGDAAKRSIQSAHTTLLEVDLGTADRSTYDAIRRQLEGIEQRVNFLRSQLDRLQP